MIIELTNHLFFSVSRAAMRKINPLKIFHRKYHKIFPLLLTNKQHVQGYPTQKHTKTKTNAYVFYTPTDFLRSTNGYWDKQKAIPRPQVRDKGLVCNRKI